MSDDSLDKKPQHGRSWSEKLLGVRSMRVFVVCMWLLAGFFVAQLVVFGVLQAVVPLLPSGSLNAVVLTTVASAAVYLLALAMIVGVIFYVRRWTVTALRRRLGLTRWPRPKDVILALGGYVPYIMCSVVIATIVAQLVPGFDVAQEQEIGFDSLNGTMEFTLAFVALVVVAPIAEELLFRGYLFGTLRRLMPFGVTAVVVSVLFGLVHGQWNIALDTFVLSMVLCWLRETTGGIWAPIFLHMIKNGLAFTLLFVI